MEQRTDANSERIYEFIEKYGKKDFVRFIQRFAKCIREISSLNEDITSIDQERHPEHYEKKVQEIIEATNDYYGFLGSLPKDIRKYLLELQTVERLHGDTVETVELRNMLGYDISFEDAQLLSIRSIRPKNYIMQIDAISNHLAKLDGQTALRVGGKGSRPVLTTVTLDIPDHMRIEGGGTLSSYDKSVINGVTTLMESGNTVFSIGMLYHTMTGRQNPSVDEALYEELSGKLEKMRRMLLSIDLSEENEARYFTTRDGERLEIKDLVIEGYLLPLNKVTGTVNGKRTELYQIIQAPPLYTYSKLKRQLASVELSLLSAPVNNNATTIPLKTYLLQRIEMMRNENNTIRSNCILYESLYQELGEEYAGKTRRKRIRTYSATILDYFVQCGYISGYWEYRSGRSVAGIRIEL